MFLLTFSAVPASCAMLWVSFHVVNMSVWLLKPSAMPVHLLSAPAGEFCIFGSFGGVLTDFASNIAICTSFPALCMSVHLLDASDPFPRPFISFADCFAVSIGDFCNFDSIHGILTVSVTFAVVSPSIVTLGASLCPVNVSAGSPQLLGSFAQAFAPLVSRFGRFDTIG